MTGKLQSIVGYCGNAPSYLDSVYATELLNGDIAVLLAMANYNYIDFDGTSLQGSGVVVLDRETMSPILAKKIDLDDISQNGFLEPVLVNNKLYWDGTNWALGPKQYSLDGSTLEIKTYTPTGGYFAAMLKWHGTSGSEATVKFFQTSDPAAYLLKASNGTQRTRPYSSFTPTVVYEDWSVLTYQKIGNTIKLALTGANYQENVSILDLASSRFQFTGPRSGASIGLNGDLMIVTW